VLPSSGRSNCLWIEGRSLRRHAGVELDELLEISIKHLNVGESTAMLAPERATSLEDAVAAILEV
jgi:hypothetical protein